jgi:hypothetical protein
MLANPAAVNMILLPSYTRYLAQECSPIAPTATSFCLIYEGLKEYISLSESLRKQTGISLLAHLDWDAQDIRSAFFFISPLAEQVSPIDSTLNRTLARWVFLRTGIARAITDYMNLPIHRGYGRFQITYLANSLKASLTKVTSIGRAFELSKSIKCTQFETGCSRLKDQLREAVTSVIFTSDKEIQSLLNLETDLPAEFEQINSKLEGIRSVEKTLAKGLNFSPDMLISAGLGIQKPTAATKLLDTYEAKLNALTDLAPALGSETSRGFSLGVLYVIELQEVREQILKIKSNTNVKQRNEIETFLIRSTVNELNQIKTYLRELTNGLPKPN